MPEVPNAHPERLLPEVPSPRIVRPQQAPVRTVWPSESADFTPWLASNLDYLDELGLGRLSLVQVEAQLPGLGRSLDVLAETADGRRVAIENQYSSVDHDHLTRGLAYAVGHQARALVVIAEDHRPEFVAVADYLNRCHEALGDEHGTAVFLVGLSVERIDDAYVPRFRVLSQPNIWRTAVAVSESGRLTGPEEFVASCPEIVREAAEQILVGWAGNGGVVRFGRSTASLDLRNPFKSGGGTTSVFVLATTGQLTLNRGYLIDGGITTDEAGVARLNEQIHRLFPTARWGEKSYYLTIPPVPEPETVNAFGYWVRERLSGRTDSSVTQ